MSTLFEYQTSGDSGNLAQYPIGQTIIIHTAHIITSIKFKLWRKGTPSGDVVAKLYEADANHLPTGSVLATAQISASSITTTSPGVLYEFVFDNKISLEQGKEYAITLDLPYTDSNNLINCRYGASSYPGYYLINFGNGWQANTHGYDLVFEEYGVLPTPAPTNVSEIPLADGQHIQASAVYHSSGAAQGTYARIQISDKSDFSNILYDSGQYGINPIDDGAIFNQIVEWFPSSQGVFYLRMAFWDDDTYAVQSPNWGSNSFTVGYPSIQSLDYKQDKEHFAFTAKINDTYTKPPIVSLVVDNQSWLMELLHRIGKQYDGSYSAIYHADESDGTTLTDASGNGNDATLENGVTRIDGKYGKALSFDGVDDYVQTPTTPPKPITVSAWVYIENYPEGGNVNNNYYAFILRAGGAVYFYIDTSGRLRFFVYNGGSNTLVSPTALPKHQWLHVAATWDGTNATGSQKLYINGELVAENAAISDDYQDDTNTFTIGAQSSDYNHFHGLIDEIYIIPEVLSQEQIQWLMNNRVYVYDYQKTLALGKGKHSYHIEVGNVWTVLTGDTRYFEAQYALSDSPRVEVLLGSSKLNAWNVVLTEKLLPDFTKLSFDTDTFLASGGSITVKMYADSYEVFTFTVQKIERVSKSRWHVTCVSKAKEDFAQVTSFAAEAINSLDLLQSILPDYTFVGKLDETIVLQQFIDSPISDIVNEVLVLNGKYAVERNKRIIIFDEKPPQHIVTLSDAGVTNFTEDRSALVNKIREYYSIKQWPVPKNAITLFDASDWSGTVSDVQKTDIGLLGDSASFLKASGTIYRSVDFKITDFDHMHMKWNSETATSIEIRLETDSSNYYKYVHGFSGKKGAGFVLTGNSASDIVSKSITFSQTKIHLVEGYVSQDCSVNIQLKLNGNVVAESGWHTTLGTYFGQVFQNVDADEIVLQFTNLYVVTSSWGVNCVRLHIEQYVQKYQVTGSKKYIAWRNNYSGATAAHPQIQSGGVWVCPMPIDDALLGNAYPLSSNDALYTSGSAYIKCTGKNKSTGGYFHDRHFPVAMNIYQKDGKYYASFSFCPNNQGEYEITAISPTVYYEASIWVERTVSTGEYVWVYKDLDWSETYNLWDDVNIPLSAFSRVGSPSSQINTIRLIASGDNYYDSIYFTSNNPNVYYVEVEDTDSINEWGLHFQVRKTDGFSSKEAATAFARGLINLFKNPIRSFTKNVPIATPIRVGDTVNFNGNALWVTQVTYDFSAGVKILQIGMNVSTTIQFLKDIARKVDAIERMIL